MLKWQVIAAALSIVLIGVVAIDAAREHGGGRVLLYDKGVYLGPPDTVIGERTLERIRQRGLRGATTW